MRAIRDGLCAEAFQHRVLVECLAEDGSVAQALTYRHVRTWAGHIRQALAGRGLRSGALIGLVAGNTPAWVAADLALLSGRFVEVPVPLAFSAEQARSMLRDAHACLADEAGARKLSAWGLAGSIPVIPVFGYPDECADGSGSLPAEPAEDRIVKIVHTSGTTGAPKGVKIRRDALDALTSSISAVTPAGTYDRYLSMVPFSLLIEQVAAIYMPIRSGGRVVLLPESAALLGTAGSRASDVSAWLRTGRPTAAVLPPAAVSALRKAVADAGSDLSAVLGTTRPFLMAGGAPVSESDLRWLDAAGLRVHEGYGLSENSSVVAWNTPGNWRPGTAGKPLAHCAVRLSLQGELLVKSSSLFAGYTDEDPTCRPVDAAGWLHTGDRAEIDDDGFIRILGRLKNTIITSHGRNVSPEWVESRLRTCPAVVDAIVFGDGLEHLVAVLIAAGRRDADDARQQARDFAAEHLAETDRPESFIVVTDSENFRDCYFTVTGRPRRDRIFADIVATSAECSMSALS